MDFLKRKTYLIESEIFIPEVVFPEVFVVCILPAPFFSYRRVRVRVIWCYGGYNKRKAQNG